MVPTNGTQRRKSSANACVLAQYQRKRPSHRISCPLSDVSVAAISVTAGALGRPSAVGASRPPPAHTTRLGSSVACQGVARTPCARATLPPTLATREDAAVAASAIVDGGDDAPSRCQIWSCRASHLCAGFGPLKSSAAMEPLDVRRHKCESRVALCCDRRRTSAPFQHQSVVLAWLRSVHVSPLIDAIGTNEALPPGHAAACAGGDSGQHPRPSRGLALAARRSGARKTADAPIHSMLRPPEDGFDAEGHAVCGAISSSGRPVAIARRLRPRRARDLGTRARMPREEARTAVSGALERLATRGTRRCPNKGRRAFASRRSRTVRASEGLRAGGEFR